MCSSARARDLFAALLLASGLVAGCSGPDVRQRQLADERVRDRTTGSIFGTVVDSTTGAPLPRVTMVALGTRRSGFSDEHGHYDMRDLPAGVVTLRIDGRFAPGVYRVSEDTVSIVQGARVERDLHLHPWAATWAESESVGVDVPDAARFIRGEIRLEKQRYHVGEYPRYSARLDYSGPDSIYLAPATKGSVTSRNPPTASVRLDGPDCDVHYGTDIVVGGSPPHLDEYDLYVLYDGDFMPAAVTVFGDTMITSTARFGCPGSYRVEFHYQGDAPLASAWIRAEPGTARPSAALFARLRRMPRVDLRCETVVRVDP